MNVLQNEAHNIPCDFAIKISHEISIRRQEIIVINKNKKKTWSFSVFCRSEEPQIKFKRK